MFHVVYADTGAPALSIAFTSATEASAIRACLATPRPLRIARIVNDSWRIREAHRLFRGEYTPLPAIIANAEWFVDSDADKNHYAHRAKSDSNKIAYTESPEKGMDDKQTVIPINRYLARYFGDKLRSEDIAKISALYTAQNYSLTIGNDAESFRFAYSGQDVKSESSLHFSCMRYTKEYFGTPCHPAEAYAGHGLAIAYVVDPDDDKIVIARAVIWPEKMRFVKVYGTDETVRVALVDMLESRGFERADDWRGARLSVVEFGGRIVTPYIDGEVTSLEHDEDEDFMTVSRHGNIDGSTTRGWTESASNRHICECCGDRAHEDDMRHVRDELWCDSCVDSNAIFCEYDEEYFPDSESFLQVNTRRGVQTWRARNVERHAFYCDRTEEYYSDHDFTQIEVETGNNRIETWCEEESEDLFFACEKTGLAYSCEAFRSVSVETEEGAQVWEESQTHGRAVYCKYSGKAYLLDSVPDGMETSSFPVGTIADARQAELI